MNKDHVGDNIFEAFPNAARIENLNRHAGGNAEAKASEMEHAIRKHCTVHNDEDPAFYKNLSEKTALTLTGIQELKQKRERVAVEML